MSTGSVVDGPSESVPTASPEVTEELQDALLATAVQAAQEGADILRRYFRCDDLEVRTKVGYDLVTQADEESEARILEILQGRFPDHRVLAEESGWSAQGGTYQWFVDPLDGTSNFSHGLPTFCVSIACYQDTTPLVGVVLDPMGNNLFTAKRGGGAQWNGRPMTASTRSTLDGAFLATGYPFKAIEALDLYLKVFRDVFLHARGIRRCGSAALDLAYAAAGVYDGFFEFRLSPWDVAAGILLVREAGGVVTDLDGGEDFLRSGNLIAGPEGVYRELLAVARQHVDEARLDAIHPVT